MADKPISGDNEQRENDNRASREQSGLPAGDVSGGSSKVRNSDAQDVKSKSGRTSGTNRDFDEKGESANQGHGHPREERGTKD